MSLESADEFDPSEELTYFHDPEHELYGLSERIYFYLIMTCRAIEAFAEPVFSIGSLLNTNTAAGLTPAGCFVEFIIRQAFSINVTLGGRVQLWTYSADDARSQYLVHDGDASDPKVWESLLKTVGRVEKFGVHIPHADKLRQMWSEWLVEQKRRDDERGW